MFKPSQTTPLPVRIPADLREYLRLAATAARRSLNSEILLRLEQSRQQDSQQQGRAMS